MDSSDEDYGITFGNYSEFFITISHPNYSWLNEKSAWPADKPLKFKIEEVFVTVSSASRLLAMLTESHFRDSDYHQNDFTWFSSVSLIGAAKDQAKDFFHKAVYYLNAHYLRPLKIYANLLGISAHFEDPLGLYDGTNAEAAFKRLTRHRLRKRSDFHRKEPLILYNHACSASGTSQFLSFYRVLEFFFRRNILLEIEQYRKDLSYSAEDIFSLATSRNEPDQLSQLFKSILTSSQKKNLAEYAHRHGLIKGKTVNDLYKGLYSFRNSIVHAKEQDLNTTNLPDPFVIDEQLDRWIYIARECADSAIKRLNSKKS
ncbi:MAG: hypothetical protein JW725_04970 [Candidatus Babeliaceae bacterium]|nr:hypothetical protein [Candidatus Babeliaceae bacterium]